MDLSSKSLFLLFSVFLMIFSVSALSIESDLLEYEEDEAWLHYSPGTEIEFSSNNHNLVIIGNTTEVRESLENNVNGGWSKAEGTERYANINGEWVLDDYQLERGHYFTTRYHLRGYKASNLTLVQAHYEHFDWFSLSHEVESNVAAREFLVDGLKDNGFEVELIRSEENRYVDSDGWIAVAVLGFLFAVFSRSGFERREINDYVVPFAGMIGLIAAVRLGSIGLYGVVTPHQIFLLLYPLLLIGLPLTAFLYGKSREGLLSGVIVFAAFISAVVLDYLYLGVESVPTEIIIQRLFSGLALAVIAISSNLERDYRYLGTGLMMWLIAILMALL